MMPLTERVERKLLHPHSLDRELHRRDIGYFAFLIAGLVLMGAFVLNWLPTDTWVYVALDWLYRWPVLFLFTAASILGGALSLVVWREWRLLALTASMVLAASTPWIVMRWQRLPDPWVGACLFACVLLAVGLPLWWFAVDRPRIRKRYPPLTESGWLEPDGSAADSE